MKISKKYFTHNRLKNNLNNKKETLGITLKIFILDCSPTLYTGFISTSRKVQNAIFNLTNKSLGIP